MQHTLSYRVRPPSQTLAQAMRCATAIGVTRLGDATGFDRIGIPVWQAVRPMARSLTVSQGKGLTAAAAKVAALMEAIEFDHAERLPPGRPREPADAAAETAVWRHLVTPHDQPRPFAVGAARAWLDGRDLLGGGALPVPRALVSMDFTEPAVDDLTPCSNGLASGNTPQEALFCALCEVIERDAHARWLASGAAERRACEIDPAGEQARAIRWSLARIARADCTVRLWDLSHIHRVPVAVAMIFDGTGGRWTMRPAMGAGCRPRREEALLRAICEAAQSRVTLIAGARDDIAPDQYDDGNRTTIELLLNMLAFAPPAGARPPCEPPPSIEAAIEFLLGRCAAAGAPAVAALDLTRAEHGIPVVKLVVPGFGDHIRALRRTTRADVPLRLATG